jgi:hypothetical protein
MLKADSQSGQPVSGIIAGVVDSARRRRFDLNRNRAPVANANVTACRRREPFRPKDPHVVFRDDIRVTTVNTACHQSVIGLQTI